MTEEHCGASRSLSLYWHFVDAVWVVVFTVSTFWADSERRRNGIAAKTIKSQANVVQLPAPTAWPLVLALGISLMLAGMVTNVAISLLGLVLAVAGSVGWFRQVLPHRAHEAVAGGCRRLMPVVSARDLRRTAADQTRCIARSYRSRPSRSPPGSKAASPAASRCRSGDALQPAQVSQPLVRDQPAGGGRLCQLGRCKQCVP